MSGLSYEQTGVNYDRLDKRSRLRLPAGAAADTTSALRSHDLSEPANIRGEEVRIFSNPPTNISPMSKRALAPRT